MLITTGAPACQGPETPAVSHEQGNADQPSSSDGHDPASMASTATQGVTGHVTASDGSAIVGAWIRAKSTDSPSRPVPEMAVVTDETGKYEWTLRTGTYEVSVTVDGYKPAAKTATVSEGAATTLDFQLEPAT